MAESNFSHFEAAIKAFELHGNNADPGLSFASKNTRARLFPKEWITRAEPYPEWIPTVVLADLLVAEEIDHKVFKNSDGQKHYIRVLRSLCSNPDMEAVWRKLVKRETEAPISLDYLYKAKIRDVPQECATRMYCSPWDLIPPSERTREHTRLLQQLKQIIRDLESYNLGGPFHKYLTEQEASIIFTPSLAENLGEFVTIYNVTLRDMLSRMTQDLESNPPHDRSLIHNTDENARFRLFCIELANYFREAYGIPLHENVAAIAGVLFGREVKVKTVQNIIRKAAEPFGDREELRVIPPPQ